MNLPMLLLALTLTCPISHSLPAPFSSGMTGAWHSYLGHPFRRRQENEVNNQRLLWSSVLSHHRSKFPLKQEFGQRRSRLWHNFSTLGGRHPWKFQSKTFEPENRFTNMFKLNEKRKEMKWVQLENTFKVRSTYHLHLWMWTFFLSILFFNTKLCMKIRLTNTCGKKRFWE